MSESKYIPDIVVIGAMKAGTSTLFRDIFDCSEITRTAKKEVNYFLRDMPFADLNELYKSQFYSKNNGLKCDVSPKYAQRHKHHGVAQRIYNSNPNAKIIYITRDPIDRIVSHLHHNLLRDRFQTETVEQEVLYNPEYLYCSMYHHQIAEYLHYFPRKQILVMILEELVKKPEESMILLNDFLGTTSLQFKQNRFNASENRYLIKWYDYVHTNLNYSWFVRFYHYFWYFVNIKPLKPRLSEKVIEELKRRLIPDIDLFVKEFELSRNSWPLLHS